MVAGAVPIAGLGVFYHGDPTGGGREPPFLVEGGIGWQVCTRSWGKLVRIIADVVSQADAEAVLARHKPRAKPGARKGFKPHDWVSGGETPAFLVCTKCGMEHTMRSCLGKVGGARFWWRMPGGEWQPAPRPKAGCSGALLASPEPVELPTVSSLPEASSLPL